MVCPKCQSENVNTQIVTETKLKTAHRGIIWWCFVGWWWVPLKWFFFTLPALLVAIFKPKRQKLVTKQKTMCVCQQCGHTWKI